MYTAEKNTARKLFWCRDHKGTSYTWEDSLELIREFHGHAAPGLAVGVKMVALAMERISKDSLFDVVCETRSCLPDAVQILTMCTIGNGWLKIKDIGRYALTLFDKSNGNGVRVFLDPEKLRNWPEFHAWFYKLKSKQEQDFDLLMKDIRNAGDDVLSTMEVLIRPEYLVRHSKGRIGTCPVCGEAYPLMQGDICTGCQGEAPCKTTGPVEELEE